MKLNEKLIKLRKSKGLTQDELAEKLGVSRQAISKWELGDSEPELNKVKSICDYFGVDYNYLIDENETLTNLEKGYQFKKINFLPLFIGLFICSVVIFLFMIVFSGYIPMISKVTFETSFSDFWRGSYDSRLTFIIYKIVCLLFLTSSITFGILTFKLLIKQGYIKKKTKNKNGKKGN